MSRIIMASLAVLLVMAAALVLLFSADHVGAAFPGANGKIVFSTWRDGNYEIYVMNANGSGQTNLSNNAAGDEFPAWSPDGSKIVFQRNLEIYVMNANGTGQTNLTNNAAGDQEPDWSPDGSKIAFRSSRDGNVEIYKMNADGSGQTRLTNNTREDAHPAWSPDGSKIAFAHNLTGEFQVYTMNANGSGQANLSNNISNDWEPDWQPLGPVGGVADLPDAGVSSGVDYAVLAGGLVAALLALTASAWLARRRWLR